MPPEGSTKAETSAPLTTRMLSVGQGHVLYVETVGSADGVPAVYLHGGPGSGCQPGHRALFDPAKVHAVLFDQRGAGRSTPRRLREDNTTEHLIADMELIRAELGFERWLVVGGSWGATLALAYAQAHPARVSGIVLRATFLATRAELERAFGPVLETFYPQLHADFLSLLEPAERAAPLDAYWRRILDPDPAVHVPAAWAWHDVERILSQVNPQTDRLDLSARRGAMPASPFMEAHYFSNDGFLSPDQLMENAGKLSGIPGRIIQGRYDLLCPPATTHALAARWPDARVQTVPVAGHGQTEPGVEPAMRAAIAELVAIL